MMTASLLSLCLTASLLTAEERPLVSCQLHFPDGDNLTGSPAGLDAEGFLQWTSPLLATDYARFGTSHLDSITLQALTPPVLPETTQALLSFQSHVDQSNDILNGELLGFNDETVKLKTWYAGEVELKRAMLKSVTVDTAARPIITGAGKLSDWETIGSSDAWKIDKNVFTATNRGSLARELSDLPNLVQISFDLSFDYSPYLRIFLFSDSGTELIPRTGYSITIQNGPMQFIKRKDNRTLAITAQPFGNRHDFRNESSSHVEIFLDRAKGLMKLYIGGVLVCSAEDPDPLLEGDWFHLSTLQEREHVLSNFTLRPWNGELPEKQDYLEFREELPGDGEQIELQNGDTVVGRANAIIDGKLTIETEFVPVAVPLDRLKSFQISSEENREEPRIYREDVRCYFHDGTHVTLRLSDISMTTISGYSQVFGDLSFDLRAFSHINFNPYDREARLRRGEAF